MMAAAAAAEKAAAEDGIEPREGRERSWERPERGPYLSRRTRCRSSVRWHRRWVKRFFEG